MLAFFSTLWFTELFGLLGMSVVVSLITQLGYKFLTNQDRMKEINKEIKELRAQSKGNKDPKKSLDVQTRILELSNDKMKQTLKPMVLNLVLFAVLYPVIGGAFGAFVLVDWGTKLPVVGAEAGWLLTLAFFSLFMNPIVKKALKVHM